MSSIVDTVVGQELPPMVKPPIAQDQLNRYAEASGDFNPIHLNEEAARRVGLDGIIAHGMLSMAFLGQYISGLIASDPQALLASLKVRYVSMVRLGDTLTCQGVVKNIAVADGNTTITIECWTQNQRGEKVTVGEAEVAVPLSETAEANV
jgi:acyl dehydratase